MATLTKSRSSITTKTMKPLEFSAPGKLLLQEFIRPLGLTQYRVAKDCRIPHPTMTLIINGRRSISAENAVRLGRYFSTGPEFWLNLQTAYDLRQLRQEKLRLIEEQVQPLRRAA
jgi:antitoxin HigA-1